MHSDETDKPIDALAMIKNVVEKLGPTISEVAGSIEKLGRVASPKEQKGSHSGSKNKSQKRNKKRYLMAKESNRINRKRIKGWKY